jgi:hypothetical protein
MTLILAYNNDDEFSMYSDRIASIGGIEISDNKCQKIFDMPSVIIGTLGAADDMVQFIFNKKKLNPLEFKKLLIKAITEAIIPTGIELLVFFKETGDVWNYTVTDDGDSQSFRYGKKFIALGMGHTIAEAIEETKSPAGIFSKVNEIYPIISKDFDEVVYVKTKKTNGRGKKANKKGNISET